MSSKVSLSSAEEVVEYVYPLLAELDREHFYVFALNTKNHLIRVFEVSIGTLDASIVHPREVFKSALLASAAALVLVHNHPSGDPEPSKSDRLTTNKLIKAGELLGIPILDHIVVGTSGRWESIVNGNKGKK